MTKLFETKHPYYGTTGAYYGPYGECHTTYASWGDFIATEGGADPDLNLVYRWDWRRDTDDDCYPLPPDQGRAAEDPYYRAETLTIFFMLQRKAQPRSVDIQVCRADEPEARAWLQTRWEQLRKLWTPLSGYVDEE